MSDQGLERGSTVHNEHIINELVTRIETAAQNGQSIDRYYTGELEALGPQAAPALPALSKLYEKYYRRWNIDDVKRTLNAIGPAAATTLRHVQAIYDAWLPGNYPVCGPCEARLEQSGSWTFKCPKCGRVNDMTPHY